MNKKEIFINEQPADVKIIQASCLCGNLLEERGIKDKDDLQPIYKYKCTKCKADYESTDYFPRIEYDVKFSPTEGQRYNKHGYKIGGEEYSPFKERKFRGKPLSDFEYEMFLRGNGTVSFLKEEIWVPVKIEDFKVPTEIPEYIKDGWVRIIGEKAPETINRESYQSSVDYWTERAKAAEKRNRDEVIELRKELDSLKSKKSTSGDVVAEAYHTPFIDFQATRTLPHFFNMFRTPEQDKEYWAEIKRRNEADKKVFTPFTDYLEKKWLENYHKQNEEWFSYTHDLMFKNKDVIFSPVEEKFQKKIMEMENSIMAGSPPKSKRELTYSQCKEIARLIWGRNYIPDMDIRVHKTPIMITMHSRNLHCRIYLNDLSVVNACAHFHPHHNKPIRHPKKIAAKFKEWGIEPLKEKTIFDLTEADYRKLADKFWPNQYVENISVEIYKQNAVVISSRTKKRGFTLFPDWTISAWGPVGINHRVVHDFLRELNVKQLVR